MESREQVELAAAGWIARRGENSWGEAQESALQEWLAHSAGRRAAYFRLNSAWQESGRLKALGSAPGVVASSSPSERSPWWTPTRFAVAASVLLATALAIGAYLWPGSNSYRTPVGGMAAVPMPDGSRVTLNTDSQVRIAVSASERRVDLQRGEAFFDVAKDARRPFVVVAGDRRVVAVGTRFSVMREKDVVRVIVTDGLVRVERSGVGSGSPPVHLAAGNVARAGSAGVMVQEKSPAEAEEYLSWRSGYVVFHQNTLADIVAEFNRYNTRRIVIEDPEVAAIHFGGNFRPDNVDGFLRLLQQGVAVDVVREGDRIALRRAPSAAGK